MTSALKKMMQASFWAIKVYLKRQKPEILSWKEMRVYFIQPSRIPVGLDLLVKAYMTSKR